MDVAYKLFAIATKMGQAQKKFKSTVRRVLNLVLEQWILQGKKHAFPDIIFIEHKLLILFTISLVFGITNHPKLT